MPRNGSGDYSLVSNSWNPALNGTPATASDWQTLINDVQAGLTQSLSRDGQTVLTGSLQMGGNGLAGLGAGSATTPILSPTGDPNTGVFFPAADTVAVSVGGTEKLRSDSTTALAITGKASVSDSMSFAAGTSALPSISTTGDSNTGFYFPAADTVGVATAGVDVSRWTSSGYFKVSNTGAFGGVAGLGDLTNSTSHIFQTTAAGAAMGLVQSSTTASGYVSYQPAGANGTHFAGVVNNVTSYQVLSNGNVQNTNNSYGAISDAKLKNLIGPKASTWETTKAYEWVEYTIKSDSSNTKLLGLIAQQAQQVSPGVIESTPDMVEVAKFRTVDVPAVLDEDGNEVTPATTREEEYTEFEPNGEVTLGVKYSVVSMQYHRTVQEAQLRIEALESALAVAFARLDALEAK